MGKPEPTAVSTTQAQQLARVVEALQATPESINPATQLYYQLYLEYTFGSLDLGKLLLQQDNIAATLQDGKVVQEEAKTMLKRLRALPSRSSRYVPL